MAPFQGSVGALLRPRAAARMPSATHLLLLLLLLGAAIGTVNSMAAPSSNTGLVANAVLEDPEFTDIIENITVPAGRNVKLACSVKNLGSYKVAWMHFEQSAILTVHNHVITRNPRISVTHDKHDKHKTWFLHISNVQEEDKGRYMCQINTVTAKTQFGYLHVVVPPNIDDSVSSSDVIVREGANVTLRCKATGSPPPSIKWKRDDNTKIAISKNNSVLEWEGDTLTLSRVSRFDMGAYLCIASNGVPPSVSKRIKVSVDFPPMLWIPHQLVGIPVGYNVTLECNIEAHPTSLNYWTRENDQMIHDSGKYKTESIPGTASYKAVMRLFITEVQHSDYGIYKCIAKNPRGETDGTIRLYSSNPPTTVPPPTTEAITTVASSTKIFESPFGPTTIAPINFLDRGNKLQNSLNQVDRSEQKSSDSSKSSRDRASSKHPKSSGPRQCTTYCSWWLLVALLALQMASQTRQ
ncbi:lachesin-like [Toxorhynchites rutilus septentrionalis]|uniref:lachesin-like n=1 Tax=Toxorhynchites rutilus septentrionalis TaxID=329112 RepID=UPI00247AECA9|nr:lachesin-like [Toxorhynchites rutilus septentrionalis]